MYPGALFPDPLDGRTQKSSDIDLLLTEKKEWIEDRLRTGWRPVTVLEQWHKRENVLDYLGQERREIFRRKLQNAYEEPDYDRAKKALSAIRNELKPINLSAVNSLDEGFEETLTLQRLGLFEKLGKSFKTTNCIENVNKQLELYTGRISRWHGSDQRQRWVATALLEIEPRLNRVMGHENLKELRAAMKQFVARRKQENAA